MTPSPPTVRAAHARLAAIRRWRPTDEAAIRSAKRDLVVAQAATLTATAAALLRGHDDLTEDEVAVLRGHAPYPSDEAFAAVVRKDQRARVARLADSVREAR